MNEIYERLSYKPYTVMSVKVATPFYLFAQESQMTLLIVPFGKGKDSVKGQNKLQ